MEKALDAYSKTTGQQVKSLKKLQELALDNIIKGTDLLAVLPTSYGKSLIYELVPFLITDLICIVTVPLNAIVEQQCAKLGELCIKVADVQESMLLLNIKFIIGHPEDFLNKPAIVRKISSTKKKFMIVVDECHCILEWGPEFRPQYTNICNIKTMLGGSSRCQTLALTATASAEAQEEIIANLKMHKVAKVIAGPMRENLFLCVQQRKAADGDESNIERTFEYVLTGLYRQLKEDGDKFPLTIVYINNFHWCGFAYELGKQVLKQDFYQGNTVVGNERVQQYHAHLHPQTQAHVTSMLKNQDSALRILLATAALGMGADIKHISQVVHLSPPTTLEGYVQQVGRCGRGGQPAKGLLYFTKSDLSNKNMRQSIKDYCVNNSKCRRELIEFIFGKESGCIDAHKDSCCDICKNS